MTEALLRIKDLHAWYGDSHALHGVSFDVSEGQTVTSDRAQWCGQDHDPALDRWLDPPPDGQHPAERRGSDGDAGASDRANGSGLCSRGARYLCQPVGRGKPAAATCARATRRLVGRDIRDVPNLHERRNSPGTKLSGGEQQMLALARVLRSGARFLLLDEPTEGLAPVIVQRIAAVLTELKSRGYTTLLVEQNFRFAAGLSDRMFVVEHGKIVDQMAGSEAGIRKADLDMYLGV